MKRCIQGYRLALAGLIGVAVICLAPRWAIAGIDFTDSITFWKERAYVCMEDSKHPFPSKADEKVAPKSWVSRAPTNKASVLVDDPSPKCDSNDMNLFNGLLCLAGEERGCRTVRASQSKDGRWWRSPVAINSADPSRRTFSPDQARGVFAYLIVKKDRSAFKSWVHWIDKNARCSSGQCVQGWPRLCDTDDCTFRPGTCSLFLRMGEILNVIIPFCDPVAQLPWPAVASYLDYVPQFKALTVEYEFLRKGLGKIIPQADNVMPKVESIEKDFNNAEDKLQKSANTLHALENKFDASSDRYGSAGKYIVLVGALVNKPGFPQHLADLDVFLFKKLGLSGTPLDLAAKHLAVAQPKNPFFEYNLNGPSDKAQKDTLNECPTRKVPSKSRTEWAWERSGDHQAWLNSMYWDCIFMVDLIDQGPITSQFDEKPLPQFPLELGDALAEQSESLAAVQYYYSEMQSAVSDLFKLYNALQRPLKDPMKIAKAAIALSVRMNVTPWPTGYALTNDLLNGKININVVKAELIQRLVPATFAPAILPPVPGAQKAVNQAKKAVQNFVKHLW